MKRRERVLSALRELAEQQIAQSSSVHSIRHFGLPTSAVAELANVTRSNCSAELNKLCMEKIVQKSSGRPTRYWPVAYTIPALPDPTPQDAFSQLVGSSHSLQEAVRQAKIAVSYPPNGMHALIFGEAGVGKSTFARTMHQYAMKKQLLQPESPFIPFNCAEYAHNPEILLDHLFGHVRGAFTGAHQEKQGLIELAHGGVLFLDEIHRLPPQGQEMLFHWLDSGYFRRMGETEAKRFSQALLLAATTETDETTLLITFRRRIPVTISLPTLREWSLHDRYALLYQGVREEADTLKRPIQITSAAVDKLLFAHFPGNIGGLRNALKLACARVYALETDSRELLIDVQHVQLAEAERITLVSTSTFDRAKGIRVSPGDTLSSRSDTIFEESLYGYLSRVDKQLQDIGLAHEEIVVAIERELSRRQFTPAFHPSLEELRKFVGDTLYNRLRRCWDAIDHRLDTATSEFAFIRVCVHLSGLLRGDSPIDTAVATSVFDHVRHEYPALCSIAEAILTQFASESRIQLPAHEVPLVALLLKTPLQERAATVGVVILMRGEALSTQLASSVQKVCMTVNIVSVDAMLDADPAWLGEQVMRAVRLVATGRGTVVMSDIPFVNQWTASQESVVCLYRPDLTMILETVLSIDEGSLDLAALQEQFEHRRYRSSPTLSNQSNSQNSIQSQIWTCCLTGRGTSLALKRLIEDALPIAILQDTQIIPVEVGPNGSVSSPPPANLLAIVGSVRPNIQGVPFFSVEELLSPLGLKRLLHVIGHRQSIVESSSQAQEFTVDSERSLQKYAEDMLAADVRFVNPKMALLAAEDAVLLLQERTGIRFDATWQIRFAIHMAYAVERYVRGTPLSYPDAERVRLANATVWSHVEHSLQPYRELFEMQCDAAEIAFVCDMLSAQVGEREEQVEFLHE